MKLNIKILIIFICAFISVISQTNLGICSDNVPVAPNQIETGAAVQSEQPQESAQEIPQSPQPPETPQVPEAPQPPSIPTANNANPPSNNGFIAAFVNMAKVLLNVVIAIITAAGLIVLYRRFKSKISLSSKSKNQNGQDYENNMPTNVSEAVSSFVRHRIKRTS